VLDRSRDLYDALCTPVCRLQRHDHEVAGTECRERHEREPRGTVEDDHVVEGTKCPDRIGERVLQIALLPHSLVGHVKAGEERIAGDDVDVRIRSAADQVTDIRIRGWIEQSLDARSVAAVAGKGVAEIALGIGINAQASQAPLFADRGQEPCRMRLANPTLQVEDGQDDRLSRAVGRHAAQRTTVARRRANFQQLTADMVNLLGASSASFGSQKPNQREWLLHAP
jgi:hypothetical protein